MNSSGGRSAARAGGRTRLFVALSSWTLNTYINPSQCFAGAGGRADRAFYEELAAGVPLRLSA